VYMTSPGAQVFDMICSRCHGPAADGQSSLASTIADLTGGLTRVANLRDGIFGPIAEPGVNRRDSAIGFGRAESAVEGVSAEDWAARYVVWMGLGGTRANIPKTAVASVGRSEILGERSGVEVDLASAADAANMLEIAVRSCEEVLPRARDESAPPGRILFDPATGQLVADPGVEFRVVPDGSANSVYLSSLAGFGLVTTNGHAELWQRLCRVDNPLPVRIVSFETMDLFYVSGLYVRDLYPSQADVGDHRGQIRVGVQLENEAPWCVARPTNPALLAAFEAYVQRTGRALPMCPDQLDPLGHIADSEADTRIERWAVRGAMNAGMSVFLYLDALSKREVSRQPAYNRCEDLGE
jgi:hypothetical protein